MAERRRVRLADVTTKIGSGATPRGGSAVYGHHVTAFVRSQNVHDNQMLTSDIAFISDSAAELLKGVAVRKYDVLINITGDSIARCALVDLSVLPACVSQHVAILRADAGLDPRYLQKYLVNPPVKEWLLTIATGGTRPALTKRQLANLEILVPPISEQRAIAEVLGALDDKIAANAALATNLEALAVDLVSGLKVTVALDELVEYVKASVAPDAMTAGTVAHFSLPAFDSGRMPELVEPTEIKSSKFVISNPSVLVSKLNPRIRRIWNVPVVADELAVSSTEFLVLEPRYCTSSLLWALLSRPSFSTALEGKVAGTSGSHQRVRPADLLATPVPEPREIRPSLADLVTSLGLRASQAMQEKVILASTRDALLPALMSGKLRVRDAEKTLEKVL